MSAPRAVAIAVFLGACLPTPPPLHNDADADTTDTDADPLDDPVDTLDDDADDDAGDATDDHVDDDGDDETDDDADDETDDDADDVGDADEEPPPPCEGEGACTSPGVCETALGALCDDGTCVYDLAPTGTACDDHDPCTTASECDRWDCVGVPYSCDDNNTCTDDVCDGAGGCTFPANDELCDDAIFCNGEDMCADGNCTIHAGDPCANGTDCNDQCSEDFGDCLTDAGAACTEDNDPCTDKQCDGGGVCASNAHVGSCDDGNPCTYATECVSGSCVGQSYSCSDGDPCTTDSCDGQGGCSYTTNSASCDDGVYCNGNDTCSDGNCTIHAGNPCPGPDGDSNCAESCNENVDACTAADTNGSSCNDGIYCDGTDTCTNGVCAGSTDSNCTLCADGSDDKVYQSNMVGCSGSVSYDDRASLCASARAHICTLQEFYDRGGISTTSNVTDKQRYLEATYDQPLAPGTGAPGQDNSCCDVTMNPCTVYKGTGVNSLCSITGSVYNHYYPTNGNLCPPYGMDQLDYKKGWFGQCSNVQGTMCCK